ncbi:hypothetical protein EIP91_010020 [Steccherinum ochraceum]|uniref:Uncharacterized protein n=1 Tax=Steccherinum ochraceum TaxID=92696 RepID=A0A4R0RAA3_9APHY|nr:hypothetical protein EIP91_010020 [Steccherinum ochraceum]
MRYTTLLAALVALSANFAFAAPTPRTARDIEAIATRENSEFRPNVVYREIVEDPRAHVLATRNLHEVPPKPAPGPPPGPRPPKPQPPAPEPPRPLPPRPLPPRPLPSPPAR